MFQGAFREFQGIFRVFFPMPFPGMPFGPLQENVLLSLRFGGIPPWSLYMSKNYRDFEASSLGILVFRGTFRPI